MKLLVRTYSITIFIYTIKANKRKTLFQLTKLKLWYEYVYIIHREPSCYKFNSKIYLGNK